MSVRASMSSARRTRASTPASAVFESMRFVAFRRRSPAGSGRAGGPEEREGKIKGATRACPECESARGFGAARQPAVPVLHANTNLHTRWIRDVPSATLCATYHVGPRHGIA